MVAVVSAVLACVGCGVAGVVGAAAVKLPGLLPSSSVTPTANSWQIDVFCVVGVVWCGVCDMCGSHCFAPGEAAVCASVQHYFAHARRKNNRARG
jgi:hypothetical protein